MDKEGAFSTESQIQYLPSLLAKLERGEIQIPVFQRPFVWKQAQVLELLESIYNGYPIGALFFWLPGLQHPDMGNNNFLLAPIPAEDYLIPRFKEFPSTYVLDGVQRLTSLYGVFNWKSIQKPSSFNIIFDLRQEKFLPYKTTGLSQAQISLSALFTPTRFFDAQRQFETEEDSEVLIERAIDLHSRFQEYSVPVITIRGGDAGRVIEIFERINTRGTQLTFSDLVTSLVTRTDFNFNDVLEEVDARLSEQGFTVSRDFFVKVVAIILNRSPSPREVLYLRELSSKKLLDACDLASRALERVSDFLRLRFQIYSFECVPYEEQLLVFVKLFSLSGSLTPGVTREIVSWFWKSSFSHAFSGKTLDSAMNVIRSVERILEGDYSSLEIPFEIKPNEFLTRSFIRGRALSLAVSALMAVRKPRSLITGEPIAPAVFMNEASLENFHGLFPLSQIQLISQKQLRSSRVIANTIVISEAERLIISEGDPKALIQNLLNRVADQVYNVLDSQLISQAASEHILKGDVLLFLQERAKDLFRFAASLADQPDSSEL